MKETISVPVHIYWTSGKRGATELTLSLDDGKLNLSPDHMHLYDIPLTDIANKCRRGWEILFKGEDNNLAIHGLVTVNGEELRHAVNTMLGIRSSKAPQ